MESGPKLKIAVLIILSVLLGMAICQYFVRHPSNVDIDGQADYCVGNIEKILILGIEKNSSDSNITFSHNFVKKIISQSNGITVEQVIGEYFSYGMVSRWALKQQLKSSCLNYDET